MQVREYSYAQEARQRTEKKELMALELVGLLFSIALSLQLWASYLSLLASVSPSMKMKEY